MLGDELPEVRSEERHGFKQLARGTVVRHEEDEGIVEVARLREVIDDAADVPVHALDHAGIDLHRARRQAGLLLCQFFPKPPADHRVRCRIGGCQPELFEVLQSFKTKRLGSCGVATAVVRDDFCRRLQWPMRGRISEIGKERPAAVAGLEIADQAVGEGVGRMNPWGGETKSRSSA